MRSVNTSLVVLLPILSLLFFGGDTLKDFAFAMFVGVTTGAYSSIFIAAPILVILKGREAKYQQLEARRQVRGAREQVPRRRRRRRRDRGRGDGEAVAAVPAAASAAAATRATARDRRARRGRVRRASGSRRRRSRRR